MNVPKTPNHKLIGAARALANDALTTGVIDLNVLPAVLYEIADRLAELTQPQPIETAPRGVDIKLFGGTFSILKNDYSDETYGDSHNNFEAGITGHFYPLLGQWVGTYDGIRTVINNPTHWLPCVQVDLSALEGKGDGA